MEGKKKIRGIAVQDIALTGMMTAVIEVSKAALGFLPNIELTSFWIILFTLFFGRRILFVVPTFILIEGAVYGFGLWWVMYLYALTAGLTWWVAGIPWDIAHGVGNFVLMLVLYKPVLGAMRSAFRTRAI